MMENIKSSDQDKYKRVRKRVDELKGFYIHLSVYVVINTFILVNMYISALGEQESFWQAHHFFTAIFWGVGLAVHAAHTFLWNSYFGRDWEERQIKKILDKDREEFNKYQ